MLSGLLSEILMGAAAGAAKDMLLSGDAPNIPMPTMGGPVFWNDLATCNGWVVQQNMFTNHARILDPNGIRVAYGNVNVMRAKFAQMMTAKYGSRY